MSGPKLTTTATVTNPNIGDYELDDSGQPVFLFDDITDLTNYAQAVAQRLKSRWQFMLGEWYLDQRLGTPWTQVLFTKGVTIETLKRAFRTVALDTPGVRSITSLTVTIDRVNRQATLEYALTLESDRVVTTDQLDAPFVVDIPEVQNG